MRFAPKQISPRVGSRYVSDGQGCLAPVLQRGSNIAQRSSATCASAQTPRKGLPLLPTRDAPAKHDSIDD